MFRTGLLLVSMLAGTAIAMAQGEPVKARHDVMDKMQDEYNAINQMVRGQTPFDAARVQAAYAVWDDGGKRIPTLFPQGSVGDGRDNRASPKIWEARADFDARIAAFAKAVADTRGSAASLDGLKAAFPAISKGCNDCHGEYRMRRQR